MKIIACQRGKEYKGQVVIVVIFQLQQLVCLMGHEDRTTGDKKRGENKKIKCFSHVGMAYRTRNKE